MRILLGHSGWSDEAVRWFRALAERARGYGFEVEPICLVPDAPAPWLRFDELDRGWRRRDRALVRLRDELIEAARGADVFWSFNGANVHPDWLPHLSTLNVYGCFDDPESSAKLSAPVARYFDAALVGNLACLPLYRSWGVRRVAWVPNAFVAEDCDPALTPETVSTEERPIDVVFFGERESAWRRERLDRLAKAFPTALFHGRGWESGYVSAAERRRIYRNTKIGWNLHNSVGPVNLRTFALPAAGVLQIGDNKCRLGEVFRLGEEVAGFDCVAGSMDECIELTRHYLARDDERRRVAASGLARYLRDYAEPRLWESIQRQFGAWIEAVRAEGRAAPRWKPPSRVAEVARRALARAGVRPTRARTQAAKDAETVALCWAAASLVGDAVRIAAIGGGAGCFAYEAAADPERTIVCADVDRDAFAWAQGQPQRPNVAFLDRAITQADGPFDLVVAMKGVDLRGCAALAPRLLVTTSEGRAGELDRVLRGFYARVAWHALHDPCVPHLVPVDATTSLSPRIAACGEPLRRGV